MPLTWDARECDPNLVDDEHENVKTQTIVLMMPAMGMRSITESNWKEVYIRCAVLHKIHHGAFMHLDGKRYDLTPEDIRARIGLKTNSTFETKAQWTQKIMEGMISNIRWDLHDRNL